MTDSAALQIATRLLDALTRQELDAVRRYLATDFVFDGPMAHFESARDFMSAVGGFAGTFRPGWTLIAAFGDEREALLLYDFMLTSGDRFPVADHYTVSGSQIKTESILCDTHGFR